LFLEHELFACAAGGIACAGFFLTQTSEADSGLLEELSDGLGRLDGTGVRCARASHPEQILEVHAIPAERNVEPLHPVLASASGSTPSVARRGRLAQHDRTGSRELSFGHQIAASIDDEVDVADEHR